MDYLNEINDIYPTRRTDNEKGFFREYVVDEAIKHGKNARVEVLDKKHHNIIIGNPENAKLIFTAHYDTPAASLIPNLMMPRNPIICYLYHFGYPFILAMLSLLAAAVIKMIFSLNTALYIAVYLVLYLGSFYLMTRAFKNKHNKNDNTSGVAVILSLMARVERDDVAFVLFDNEEKGLLGSKAFAKRHPNVKEKVPVLNLDCVGNGKNILLIAMKDAEASAWYQELKSSLKSEGEYSVMYFPKKGSIGNSDHKNFKCGIGIMACRKNSAIGYYTSRIHTSKDTVADTENIDFLTAGLKLFSDTL